MSEKKNNTLKKLKLKALKKIYQLRRYALGLGAVSIMGTASAPTGAQAENLSQTQTYDASRNIDKKGSAPQADLLAYNRMVEIDVSQEISERAEWVVDKFISATEAHLKAIKRAKARGQKTSYVKNNFFDVVYPKGGLSGHNNYCITAINRALMDANKYGDLDRMLPEYQKEGGQAVECRRFVNYLTQKGFGDCIEHGYISRKNLEIGDIVMTPRGGGRYHATTYIGNGKVRSFNNDGEWEIKPQSGIIIKTKAMAEKSIKLTLEKQKLISPNKGKKQVISLAKAQKIMNILYNGRNMKNQTAMLLAAPNDEYLLADNQIIKAQLGKRDRREM